MPVQVKTRVKRDVVTLLSDVDVGFVSLVRHGANWTPFTAIKTDTGDVKMPGQVIQAILMPVDTDISVLQEIYGEEWFSQIRTDLIEKYDHFVRFTQRPEEDFCEAGCGAAFHLLDAARTGGYFVCGTLKAEKKDSNALLPPVTDHRANDLPSNLPGEQDSPEDTGNDANRGREMTKEEIQLIVTETVAEEVKSILRDEVADVLKEGLTKIEAALATVETLAATQQPPEPAEQQVTEIQAALADLSAKLKKFESQLKAIVERQESLEHTTVRRPSWPEDPALKLEDDTDYDPENPARAFKGMFDRMVV
ncbi:MAG: hypothetical protein FJY85_03510 [Deltaproteobacteria bacterium]|nr:hypothetical protein [Deltaproteobacteria bacterium]